MNDPSGTNEQALREALSHFNDRIEDYLVDPETPVHPFWADDVELVNFEPSPFPGTFRGPDALRRWTSEIFGDFTDSSMEVVELEEEGDRLAVRMRASGRGRSSGIPVKLDWGVLFTMRDGKCVRADSDASYERTLERLRA
jgi:ketosteroid isomerase-like protein